jgi:hypothetical protein
MRNYHEFGIQGHTASHTADFCDKPRALHSWKRLQQAAVTVSNTHAHCMQLVTSSYVDRQRKTMIGGIENSSSWNYITFELWSQLVTNELLRLQQRQRTVYAT